MKPTKEEMIERIYEVIWPNQYILWEWWTDCVMLWDVWDWIDKSEYDETITLRKKWKTVWYWKDKRKPIEDNPEVIEYLYSLIQEND